MMTNSPLVHVIQSLSINSVWLGLKVVFLIVFLMYVVFTLVVISQVRQMADMVEGGFEKQLQVLSWVHLGVTLLAFIWAFMVL